MNFDSDVENLIYLQGEVDALETIKNVIKIIKVNTGTIAISVVEKLIEDKIKEVKGYLDND